MTTRLLVLATEYPPAAGYGLARYAASLDAALARQGVEVHVLTRNYDGGRMESIAGGVRVHQLPEPPPFEHYHWIGNAVLANIPLVEQALDIVEEHGPFDALVSHDWLAGLAAKSLKGILQLPWLLVMHDTEPGKRGNKLTREELYIAEMETWCARHADHVLTTSDFLAGELKRFHKVPEGKISVVPCGVDAGRLDVWCHVPDFRTLFAREEEHLLVYAGRLSPMKGVEDLAEAFLALSSRLPVRLVLAGDGVLRKPLEKRFAEAGLAGRVVFAGHVSDVVLGALYRAADLVVLPSRYEPFGLVALEAAVCGAAVLVSETGGLSEIARRSRGAIATTPPNDPAGLALSIEGLLRDGKKRTIMGRRAQEHVAGTYTWAKPARKVVGLLKRWGKARQGKTPRPPMGRPRPRVSVVTCCYRYRRRFRVFLDALARQTLPRADYELVVTDPQSPDGLTKEIERFRLENPDFNLVHVPVAGRYRANRGWLINRAFERSRGKALMVADCDVILPPHFLEKALDILDANPDRVLGVYRNLLSSETTGRILDGTVDPVTRFDELRKEDRKEELGYRGVLGYCQVVRRGVYAETRYPDDIESIGKSDIAFVEALEKKQGVTPLRIEGETLLHLWHPRDWSGTKEDL